MWAIRFLNGSLAGHEIPLQEGKYIIGRGEDCQITVSDPGISKKHAELQVDEEGVMVSDLKSSNGTFLNGVQVQECEVQNKDRVSLCKTTFDIVTAKAPEQLAQAGVGHLAAGGGNPYYAGAYPTAAPYAGGAEGAGDATASPAEGEAPSTEKPNEPVKLTLKNWFKNYMEKVVLPGVYKLPVYLEFKWVLAGFMIFFVVVMTVLSAFPLIQILNSSVAQESMNHAESIAKTLAQLNHEPIKTHIHASVSVDPALRRPGVKSAFIINAVNGKIIAPAEKAHTYSKIPFVNQGRKKDGGSVKKLDSNTVVAMEPISFFNQKTNRHSPAAFSVVMYDMGALAFGNKRTISLLVQTCFIALVLGVLLFFFLYKMIEFPISSLNKQLSSALKDDSLSVQTDYDFEQLKNLTSNINSALSRISAAQEADQSMSEYDRLTEMNHVIEMIGYPTLGVEMESMKIQGVSALFEEETGVSAERILHSTVQDLDDQALKLNLTGLLEKVQQHPQEIASDALEFSGVEFQLSAKGIYGREGLAYTLISFIHLNREEQAEAS